MVYYFELLPLVPGMTVQSTTWCYLQAAARGTWDCLPLSLPFKEILDSFLNLFFMSKVTRSFRVQTFSNLIYYSEIYSPMFLVKVHKLYSFSHM